MSERFMERNKILKNLRIKLKFFNLLTFFLTVLIALVVFSVRAEEIKLVTQEIVIPREGEHSFEFGTVQHNDKTTVLLEVVSRSNSKGLGGSTAIMKIIVNGHEVKVAKSRQAVRLVNKPLISPVTPADSGSWFADDHAWRVIYAPDFTSGREQLFYKYDPYTLVLDITDLSNPVAENRITLVNLVTNSDRWQGVRPNEGQLVIKALNIKTKPVVSPMMLPAVEVKPVINRGEPAAGPAKYQGEVMPAGGFTVKIDGNKFDFTSSFSYPNAGLNLLLPSREVKQSGQPEWKPTVKNYEGGGEVLAENPYYRLKRIIRFKPERIEVEDELTNLRDIPLGLMIQHETSLKSLTAPVVRIAGNPDPAVNQYYAPSNPSVHVAFSDKGIGLICEDDIFRNQAQLFAKLPNCGLRNQMFRLGPKATYTLKWSVYPVAGPDYFDFINIVRKDWGANFTVDGSYTLFNPEWILEQPVQKLREQFARHGIKFAISNGSWSIGKGEGRRNAFGLGVFEDSWADHRNKLREAASRIREAAPKVKIWVYYDPMRDTSQYGHEKFRDSAWTDAKGQQLSTTWGAGSDNLCYTYVPMLDNSFGQAMLAAVERYIKETDSDGIYCDEMSILSSFNSPGITYNQLDGHSCLLDLENYTIKREIGLTTLLSTSWLEALVACAQKTQGVAMLGNGVPTTRAMLETKIARMIETQSNDFWCYESNLSSPLGWTYVSRSTFDGTTRTLRMGCLPVGVPLTSEHEISGYLFPFTPIELHHAYLLGQERIITLHDGNYGWVGERCLVQLRHFNRNGLLVNDETFTIIGKEARTAVKLTEEEAMVLVRLPMTFAPDNDVDSKWQAKVNKIDYNKSYISLYLEAPSGGILKIKNGEFSLQNGKTVKVTLGNKTQQVKIVNDCLIIDIPAKFAEHVEITNGNLIDNVKAAKNGAKKFNREIKVVDSDNGKVFVVNENGSCSYTLGKVNVEGGKKYLISAKLKQFEGKDSYIYIGFISYTADGKVIEPQHGYNYTDGSFTTLTAAAGKGAKSITVKDASKWKTGEYFVAAFNAKQDKSDIPNFDIVSNCVKIEENTITLGNTIGKAYPVGTNIRQHRYGETYIYTKHGIAPTEWSTWRGEAVHDEMLRKAVYIRPMIIVRNEKDSSIIFDNLTIEEL